MEKFDDFLEQSPDMDPYDREERCRKALRTIGKAIVVRIAAGVLLLAAMIRAGASPVALGLTVFALAIILAGAWPLAAEMKRQWLLLKECLTQQENMENK